MLNVTGREGCIVVVLEEIKDRHGEEFRDDADVIPVVKTVDQMDTVAAN